MICKDQFPLYADSKGVIDCRPQSVFKVAVRFMSDEETTEVVQLSSPLLIPFYDCEVYAIGPYSEEIIEVWLDYDSFIAERYADKIHWCGGAEDAR
jgi:hypothetical protein